MRPADLPSAERFPHGTRARYVTGCRCTGCKNANVRAYHDREARALEAALELRPRPPISGVTGTYVSVNGETRVRGYRRGCPGIKGEPCPRGSYLRRDSVNGICSSCRRRLVWNGTVDADRARLHILKLARRGLGYKTVADAARTSSATVHEIRMGTKRTIRRRTEERILAVDMQALADHACVSAASTRLCLRGLLALGFPKSWIARHLGSRGRQASLQLNKRRVTLKNATAVNRLFELVKSGEIAPPRLPRWGRETITCSCRLPLEIRRNGNLYCAKCDRPLRANHLKESRCQDRDRSSSMPQCSASVTGSSPPSPPGATRSAATSCAA